MYHQYVIKKDRQLTAAAKRIFGDIVDDAYQSGYDEDEVDRQIKEAECGDDYIHNHERIVIVFTNGKSVMMSQSEFSFISSIDIRTMKEIS